MSQLKERPVSLFIFELICNIVVAISFVSLFSTIYGWTNPILSFFMGFGGSIIFRKIFGTQIERTYWWIRIFIELNLKNSKDE